MNLKNIFQLLLLISLIQPTFASTLSEAQKFYAEGDHGTAIIHIKNHLKKSPKSDKARHLLGIIYLKKGKFPAAEKELGRAWELEQDNAQYRLDYAQSLIYNQKHDEAMVLLEAEINDPVAEGKKLFLQASLYLARQDKVQAENYFQQALKKGNSRANIGLAKLALLNNNLTEAQKFIDLALDTEPDNIIALRLKAQILSALQFYSEANTLYSRLIKQNTNDLSLYLQRASVLIALHNTDAAEADIQRVLKKNKNIPEANFLLARLRFKAGDYKQAEIFSERVLSVISDHKDSLLISASANFALKNYHKAEQRVLEYLSLQPDDITIQALQARIYLAQDKVQNALLILEAMPEKKRNNSIEIQQLLTTAYLFEGKYPHAINSLQAALKYNPKSTTLLALNRSVRVQASAMERMLNGQTGYAASYQDAQKTKYLLLLSYFNQQRFAEFKEKSAEFIAATDNDANLYVISAKLPLYRKDFAAARELYNKALSYNREHAPALLAMALLAEQEGRLAAAESYFQQFYNNSRDEPSNELSSALFLIDFFTRKQMDNKRQAIINELLKKQAQNNTVLVSLFIVQNSAQDYASAEKILRSLIRNEPKSIKYHLLLAGLLARVECTEECYRLLDKTYSLDPTNPAALIAKYQYQLKSKQYKASLLTVEQIKEAFPELGIAEQLEGNTLFLSGQIDSALQSYEKAYTIQADAQLAIKIANTKAKLGTIDDAIEFLKEQLNEQSFDPYPILFHLAALHQVKKEYRSAIGYYQKILQQRPELADVLNDLAWTYMQINDPRAVETAQAAYKIQPDSANIAETYGTILVRNHKIEQGLQLLQQSIKLAPDNKNTQYQLAKTYYLQGDNDKSMTILEKISTGSDSFTEKAAAVKLLKQMKAM